MPIIVAQHLPRGASTLDAILSWHCQLEVRWAKHNEAPESGTVHIIPPGMRMRLRNGYFELKALPEKSSSWLDSGDYLIESLVEQFGSKTTVIVLSGSMAIPTAGVRAVNAAGGITMAQNQLSSAAFATPCAAIDFGKAEIVFAPSGLAQAIQLLADARAR
jgi:two-component system CheB/CheR fusion protein